MAAQRGLLMVALQSKRTDEALKLARTVQAERPTEAIGHVFEAEIHVAQRAWDAALKSYQTALDRSRSSEVARAIHAVHVRAGHQAEADRFAARWMKEQPADGDFLLHIANLAIEAKNFPQAEVHFRALQDLRPDSPTYRRWTGTELSAANGRALLIGKGMAHGFVTLEDDTDVLYQIDKIFEPGHGRGVRWNDPAFAIGWPVSPVVISERDATYPDLGA